MTSTNARFLPVVGILPIGDISHGACRMVAEQVMAHLDLSVVFLPHRPPPMYAFDKHRLQFDAAKIVFDLQSMDTSACDKVIALIDADICLPIFTHVFGEARQGGKIAVASTYRLAPSGTHAVSPAPQLQNQRLAKVALHELGHLFDLLHCDNPTCLMHFSAVLDDLDAIDLSFCRYCRIYLNDAGMGV